MVGCVESATTGLIWVPQPGQNSAPTGTGRPHFAQKEFEDEVIFSFEMKALSRRRRRSLRLDEIGDTVLHSVPWLF